jgi:hypothetical protein
MASAVPGQFHCFSTGTTRLQHYYQLVVLVPLLVQYCLQPTNNGGMRCIRDGSGRRLSLPPPTATAKRSVRATPLDG